MKGISGNPALDAYDRMSVTAVNRSPSVGRAEAAKVERPEHSPAAKVSISAQAQQLAGSAAEAQATKVDALREKIKDGTFQVDAYRVAARMLDTIG